MAILVYNMPVYSRVADAGEVLFGSGADLREETGSGFDLREKSDPDSTCETKPEPYLDPTLEKKPGSGS